MTVRFGFAVPALTGAFRPEESAAQVAARYEASIELCADAERWGFDFATVGHHRFSSHMVDASAPLVVLAAIASRTSTLRLCTNIVLIPVSDPVHLAEQAVTVEEISGGRLILGTGLGYRPHEFEAVGLEYADRAERMDEGLALLRQLLSSTGPVDFAGRHFTADGLTLSPPPPRPGGVPIWVGATSLAGARRAGRLGDAWIVTGLKPLSAYRPWIERYRAEAQAAGRRGEIVLHKRVGIAPTRAEVEREWLPGTVAEFQNYVRRGSTLDAEFAETVMTRDHVGLADVPAGMFLAGSPGDCIDQIRQAVAETGCGHVILDFGRRTDPEELARIGDAMQLFAREVIPAFT